MQPALKREFLEAFPVFKNSPDVMATDIVSVMRPHSFASQQAVFRVGDTCGVIAFLLSGQIRVYTTGASSREITLYDVERGQVCILNVACILSHQSYPALATVTQEGNALMMQASDFQRLVDTYPDMRNFVFSGLGSRFLNLMSLIEEVAFRKLDERLREYVTKKAVNGALQVTHQKIANELGTSREIISRVLEDLEQRGMVKLARNQIDIVKL